MAATSAYRHHLRAIAIKKTHIADINQGSATATSVSTN
jgi:hypothetical protein